MTTPRSDYAADFYAVEKERERTPRARALLNRVYELQGEVLDAEKRHGLESLEFALGLHCSHNEDLTEAGELSFRTRLEKLIGAAS